MVEPGTAWILFLHQTWIYHILLIKSDVQLKSSVI